MENILELRQVPRSFPGLSFHLEDTSFPLSYGAVLGFVGENGVGKISTIGCILNTIAQCDGSIRLSKKEIRDSGTDIRERIGVVYDNDNFPSYLSINQILEIMVGIYRNWDKTLSCHYLEKLKLAPTREVKQYSRGVTMRLAVAVALPRYSQLLISGEAVGELDPITRNKMLDAFLNLVQDEWYPVSLSSRTMNDLEEITDYTIPIHNGRLIFSVLKNDLRYNHAVMHCNENQLQASNQEDMMAYLKRDYQIDVLLSGRKAIQRKYKDAVVDHVSIEEIMLLLIRGERI